MNILADYLANAACDKSESHAILIPDGENVRFMDLDSQARRLAMGLTAGLGLGSGDRIAIAMSNDPAYLVVLFGAWYAGLIVAPMNPRLHAKEFAALIEDCDANVCFATPEIASKLSILLTDSIANLITVGSDAYIELLSHDPVQSPAQVDSSATAWLFYTSGTTGKPKGAMLTHGNLDAMVHSFIADSGAATNETLLHLAPLSHAGGLFSLVWVSRGLPQLIPGPDALTRAVLERCLQAAGSASFFVVPTVLKRLLDPELLPARLHRYIHKIIFGGAPMYLEDLRVAVTHFGAEKLWGGYGQGEAPCTITHLSSTELANTQRADYTQLLGSVGVPRSGVSVRVVGSDDKEVRSGEVGEIVVRGDVVMAGYWNHPVATALALRNGWLHTGDLGFVSTTGLLTLVDRSKDMIISGGSNIYPREIEEVLIQHPHVIEAAVIGVADVEWGEIPVAFIAASADIDDVSLNTLCLGNLARYKRPRSYHFVKELPKSSYGKILKSELRQLLANE